MKRNASIQLKAAFLIIVFALNTVVGFACSVGVNMGFNANHHDIKHVHHATKGNHHHDSKQHEDSKSENSDGDQDCCTDQVKKFHDLDKSVPASQSIAHPVFLTVFVAVHFYTTSLPQFKVLQDIRSFVRSYHPPIQNIRLAIQSFQI